MSTTTTVRDQANEFDTIEIDAATIDRWRVPDFQRPISINPKVLALSSEIKASGGVIPGIITLGILGAVEYIVDGQHRLQAWRRSGLQTGYVDVRRVVFKSIGAMADEFVHLNSALVRLRPDDLLRGLEASSGVLQRIRRDCPFVGYAMIRKARGPVLSMSAFIRCWIASRQETPTMAISLASALAVMDHDETEVDEAIRFAQLCNRAWGGDVEYSRLWTALNLTLSAWIFRRLVLGHSLPRGSRSARFSRDEFLNCLMALSADEGYMQWLSGRHLGEHNRSPCFNRMKAIIQRRYLDDTGEKIRILTPTWSAQ